MSAEHERGNILDGYTGFHGNKGAKSRRVEHSSHADDTLAGKARSVEGDVAHGIERIRDDDQNGIWRRSGYLLGDRFDDGLIGAKQIVTAHAWFAGDAGCDYDEVRGSRFC